MVVNLELVLSVLVLAFLWGVLFLYVHRIKVTQESQWGLDPMTEDMPRPPGESLRIRLHSLHNEFDEMLLMIIFASPVLVLPGWYVIRAGAGSVKVLNPKQLESGLSGKKQLNDEQIAMIDHQLKILTVCEKG